MAFFRKVTLGTAALIFFATSQSPASFLETHAFGLVQINNDPLTDTAHFETPGEADTGLQFEDDSFVDITGTLRVVESTGQARTSLSSSPLLGTVASVSAVDQATDIVSYAFAAWRDIAFYDGASASDSLTLHFDVKAVLDGVGSNISAGLYIEAGATANFFGLQRVGGVGLMGRNAADPDDTRSPVYFIAGFADRQLVNGEFRDSFQLVVPYDVQYGGFPWAVSLTALALASNPPMHSGPVIGTSIEALNGIRLTHVTDASGAVVPVTFDSGLRIVPEPGAMVLAIGLVVAAIAIRRPRDRHRTWQQHRQLPSLGYP